MFQEPVEADYMVSSEVKNFERSDEPGGVIVEALY